MPIFRNRSLGQTLPFFDGKIQEPCPDRMAGRTDNLPTDKPDCCFFLPSHRETLSSLPHKKIYQKNVNLHYGFAEDPPLSFAKVS